MVREPEFKFEEPGFEPLLEQGEGQVFCPAESTLVQTRLCRTPVCVYGTSKFVRTLLKVKAPISICHQRVGNTASGMETRKHCAQGRKKPSKLGSTAQWLLAFPRGNSPNFRCITMGVGQESNLL